MQTRARMWMFSTVVMSFSLAGCVRETKVAFILNQRVFNEFDGKKELEEKLLKVRKANKAAIDSLGSLIQQTSNYSVIQMHKSSISDIQFAEGELTEKYTSDLWNTINSGIKEFGEQKGYDFIFGATGNGGLMYAKKGNDVTDEVIQYLNKWYSGN
ncbi:MAG: OmpH family outer membrane protein [Flammeovirgaceae bacterium]